MMKHSITRSILLLLLLQASPLWAALSDSDFEVIGRRYGVSPELLHAISIVESQGGTLTGKYEVWNVVNATQLEFLQKIGRHTGRSLTEFTGSHAGAMGYMQIIPSTFFRYAQDGDGDGIKDPLNPYDSVATAALFLAREITRKGSVKGALRSYNNSSAYVAKVFTLYQTLQSQSAVASR